MIAMINDDSAACKIEILGHNNLAICGGSHWKAGRGGYINAVMWLSRLAIQNAL